VRRLIAVTVVAMLLLAGCSSAASSASTVAVTGAAGSVPTLEFKHPLTVRHPETREIWAGNGAAVRDGESVLMNYIAEDAKNGDLVGETYSTGPLPMAVTPAALGQDLYEAIKGHRMGSRLIHLSPAVSSEESALVVVIDLLPTRALGETVPPRPELPVVTLAADGAPTITVPTSAPPTSLVVQPLIKGLGPQVVGGQSLVVQYTGVNWADGAVVDTTWAAGKGPFTTEIGLGKVIQGWDQGLIEQTVGSQVLLVIPPALGYGDKTLVFVVDILAAAGKPIAAPTGAGAASPSAAPTATG
jgi:peptidylprolyl isomerase